MAVLGDMYELGEDSGQQHFDVGRFAGKLEIDTIIGIGEHAAKICEGAEGGRSAYMRIMKKQKIFIRIRIDSLGMGI